MASSIAQLRFSRLIQIGKYLMWSRLHCSVVSVALRGVCSDNYEYHVLVDVYSLHSQGSSFKDRCSRLNVTGFFRFASCIIVLL
ncbi:hypothetical protein DPEC_G00367940 [Dallia pectoralis]|nr:hypothetical protein DPEC_G00367940 [Dallia pectoralis]